MIAARKLLANPTSPQTKELVDLILSVDELLAPPAPEGNDCVEVTPEDWADLVRLSLEIRNGATL